MYPEGVPGEVLEATAGKLGASLAECRNLTVDARVKGAARSVAVRKAAAVDAYADIARFIREMKDSGLTLRAIAHRLDAEGHTTRRGKPWNPTQISRVLERFGG